MWGRGDDEHKDSDLGKVAGEAFMNLMWGRDNGEHDDLELGKGRGGWMKLTWGKELTLGRGNDEHDDVQLGKGGRMVIWGGLW